MAIEGGDELTVRADLTARVALMRARAETAQKAELASDLAAIRGIAHANGMTPAVTVVQALDSALARGERGPLVYGWLAILDDAIGCDSRQRGADATFAAACSVRLGG